MLAHLWNVFAYLAMGALAYQTGHFCHHIQAEYRRMRGAGDLPAEPTA